MDLLDLACERPGKQIGAARWRPVIGFPRLPVFHRRHGGRARGAGTSSRDGALHPPCTRCTQRGDTGSGGTSGTRRGSRRGGWGMQGYAWGTSCPGEGGLGAGSPWGAWGASFQACGWMGPSAAPNLLDFPEKIKPGTGRVRQPPSSARHFTWAGRGAATENGKNRFEPLKSLFGVQ